MSYILSHTLVYGIIGGVFVYYLGYCKVLQVSIGAVFIGLALVLSSLWEGRIVEAGILFVELLCVYTLVQWIMMRFFPHQSQKDVFSPIFTIAAAVFVENALGFIFGPNPVSIDNQYLSSGLLLAIIICVMGMLWYLFQGSMVGKILTAARESHNTTKSLGIPLNPLLFIGAWGWFVLLIGAAWITVQTEGIKPSDGLFYLLIGVGIMVSAGERGIRGVFVVSAAYALLEYFLFVIVGIPIAYKAGLMLTLILILLLLKPEGIFSFHRRHI